MTGHTEVIPSGRLSWVATRSSGFGQDLGKDIVEWNPVFKSVARVSATESAILRFDLSAQFSRPRSVRAYSSRPASGITWMWLDSNRFIVNSCRAFPPLRRRVWYRCLLRRRPCSCPPAGTSCWHHREEKSRQTTAFTPEDRRLRKKSVATPFANGRNSRSRAC